MSIVSSLFRLFLKPPLALFRERNQRQVGMWVLRNSLAGRFTMQSSNPVSIMLFLISSSLFVLEVSEPLARTKPAIPVGERW
jgi:hypothetical protein